MRSNSDLRQRQPAPRISTKSFQPELGAPTSPHTLVSSSLSIFTRIAKSKPTIKTIFDTRSPSWWADLGRPRQPWLGRLFFCLLNSTAPAICWAFTRNNTRLLKLLCLSIQTSAEQWCTKVTKFNLETISPCRTVGGQQTAAKSAQQKQLSHPKRGPESLEKAFFAHLPTRLH